MMSICIYYIQYTLFVWLIYIYIYSYQPWLVTTVKQVFTNHLGNCTAKDLKDVPCHFQHLRLYFSQQSVQNDVCNHYVM